MHLLIHLKIIIDENRYVNYIQISSKAYFNSLNTVVSQIIAIALNVNNLLFHLRILYFIFVAFLHS